MITLSRLNGAVFALNDQLVERIEANPDTVVILVDGKKFIVAQSVEEVVEQIRSARAETAYRAALMEVVETEGPELRLINGDQSETNNGLRSVNPDPGSEPNQEGSPWTQ